MSELFDQARLAAIAYGSGTTRAEIVSVFRETNLADARALRQAAQQGDLAQMERLAHRITGACMMLGAYGLNRSCASLVSAGTTGDAVQTLAALLVFEQQLAGLTDEPGSQDNGSAAQDPQAGDTPATSALLCTGLRFFVVEDHEFQRHVITTFLRRLGAQEVRGFPDAPSVLEATSQPGAAGVILILDLALPGMNGMQLMQSIGAKGLDVSIILNSALGQDLLEWPLRTARSYGATVLGAINKPLTAAKLAPLLALRQPRPPLHTNQGKH